MCVTLISLDKKYGKISIASGASKQFECFMIDAKTLRKNRINIGHQRKRDYQYENEKNMFIVYINSTEKW